MNQTTNQLKPWNTVLEKLTVAQLVKKSPNFYGNRNFITIFQKRLPMVPVLRQVDWEST
jgi:hypothetical protein